MTAVMEFTAGVLVRRPMRRMMMFLGLSFEEEKGWFSSMFIVRGPPEAMDALIQWGKFVESRLANG